MVAEHGDALDFDLFDRWRVRLRDVPSTIGWDGVALFCRHLPYGCAVMREVAPATEWSIEAHRMADVADMVGSAFAGKDYKPMKRPGAKEQFSDAAPVDENEFNELLARFGGGDANG